MWMISQLKIPLEEISIKYMISVPQNRQGNEEKESLRNYQSQDEPN